MRRALGLLAVLLILIEAGCAGTSPSKNPPPNPPGPPAQLTITISPTSPNIRAAASQVFTAQVSNATNQNVTWAVNGVSGGSSTTGTITSTGVYAAPGNLPNPNTVTVSVTSAQDSSLSASSAVTLWNPTPAISSVSPSTFTAGSFTLTVHGSQFVNGAQVLFGGSALTTTFVSSTQLAATGSEATAGIFGVSVSNPNPGSSASGSMNVTVTAAGGSPPPPPPPPPPASACSGISVGQGGSLNGFIPFPADNLWNQNIANAPVDPDSAAIINLIGGTDPVHPDFGSGQFDGSIIGIPYFVVGAQQAPVTINLTDFADESDPGPMPVPPNSLVEGDPNPGDGDRHTLVVDNNSCWLYELYNAVPNTDGSWSAASTAVWDLQADGQRPLTWTSADAAGLSIFAGLARYDEVAAGEIKHALRVTLQNSRAAFVPPASHWAANSTNANAAPMGMRLRLKSSFNISGFSASNQVILKALQQYGLIMADNGSNMFISGAPDDRWDNDDLHNLDQATAADFEVVKMDTIYTQSNLPTGPAPSIARFTASTSPVSAGTSVTLNWNVTGASYFIVTPQIGAIRGTSVVVNPTQTTTYTLDATNEFGRTTATVTVTVQ